MTDHPIIFGAESVRAILAGSKHQTRRVIKPQPHAGVIKLIYLGQSVYGKVGDRLWVRETWYYNSFHHVFDLRGALYYRADDEPDFNEESVRWETPVHMPRWASRITLEITETRVESLQDISEADIIVEGCPKEYRRGLNWFRPYWDSINGKKPGCAWKDNPWVWVLAFRTI